MKEIWRRIQRGAEIVRDRIENPKRLSRMNYPAAELTGYPSESSSVNHSSSQQAARYSGSRIEQDMNRQIRRVRTHVPSTTTVAAEIIQNVVESVHGLARNLQASEEIEFHITSEAFYRLEQSGNKLWLRTYEYTDLKGDRHHILYARPPGYSGGLAIDPGTVEPGNGTQFCVLSTHPDGGSFSFSPQEVALVTVSKI